MILSLLAFVNRSALPLAQASKIEGSAFVPWVLIPLVAKLAHFAKFAFLGLFASYPTFSAKYPRTASYALRWCFTRRALYTVETESWRKYICHSRVDQFKAQHCGS